MYNPRATVNLRQHFTESDEFEDLKTAMEKVREEMKKVPLFRRFPYEVFDDIQKRRIFNMDSTEQANHVISMIYDYADEYRIEVV